MLQSNGKVMPAAAEITICSTTIAQHPATVAGMKKKTMLNRPDTAMAQM